MAKIFGQLEKAQGENTTSDTGSMPKGMITYRTDLNLMKVSNGTTYKALIDEDSSQTLSAKTLALPAITGASLYDEVATPANPSANHHKVYFKSDGLPYMLNSAGTEQGLTTSLAAPVDTNGSAQYDVATPTVATWYIPTAAILGAVVAGSRYQIIVQGQVYANSSTINTAVALIGQVGTSATPGSGLIDSSFPLMFKGNAATSGEALRGSMFTAILADYTPGSSVSLYLNLRYENGSGTPTVSNMGWIGNGAGYSLRWLIRKIA